MNQNALFMMKQSLSTRKHLANVEIPICNCVVESSILKRNRMDFITASSITQKSSVFLQF